MNKHTINKLTNKTTFLISYLVLLVNITTSLEVKAS